MVEPVSSQMGWRKSKPSFPQYVRPKWRGVNPAGDRGETSHTSPQNVERGTVMRHVLPPIWRIFCFSFSWSVIINILFLSYTVSNVSTRPILLVRSLDPTRKQSVIAPPPNFPSGLRPSPNVRHSVKCADDIHGVDINLLTSDDRLILVYVSIFAFI